MTSAVQCFIKRRYAPLSQGMAENVFTNQMSCFLHSIKLARMKGSYQLVNTDSLVLCYGRPLLQAWLLPDLNTIPNNSVRENYL